MNTFSDGGHGATCYYCNKACDSLAGNPSLWPIALCHSDEPGVVKWHHTGCVSERLEKLEKIKSIINDESFITKTNYWPK